MDDELLQEDMRRSAVEEGSFYLGVDGGGSKTIAVIVDAQGREQGCGRAGGANYGAIGLQEAIAHIQTAIAAAVEMAGCAVPLRAAWLGLAGVDCPEDIILLLPHLEFIAATLHLTGDAELVLSALDDAVGVALIAGTGSIALGRDAHGTIRRAGGWGHILGDEGSGYAVGRAALQAAVRAADGRGKPTLLLERILNVWQLKTPGDLLHLVNLQHGPAKIAELSPLVFTAASEGDASAAMIVQQAANELARAAIAVCKRLDFADLPISLALGGGLLIQQADYRECVLSHLHQGLSLGKVVLVEQPALSAARAAGHLLEEKCGK